MMNDNDDYLWDKTGEPDPEIQELEQVLGALRYQPRPLEIPAGLALAHKRSFFNQRRLAIAAAIAVMLLGVGLWLGFHKRQPSEMTKVPDKPATSREANQTAVVAPNKDNGPAATLPKIDRTNTPIRHRVNHGLLSREFANNRRPRVSTPNLDANERKEALAAKEQLILALRVASSKLSFAQRKAQELNSENQVHNQHKIG
jgi:hypothetical protein